uniref:Secreted protein n=1 Tax=Parascaris univalens TaxID=6257 RepID=A0A915AXY3_PARUN
MFFSVSLAIAISLTSLGTEFANIVKNRPSVRFIFSLTRANVQWVMCVPPNPSTINGSLYVTSMPNCWTISSVMNERSLPTSNSTGTLIVFVCGASPLTSTKADRSNTVLSRSCCSGVAIAATVRIV